MNKRKSKSSTNRVFKIPLRRCIGCRQMLDKNRLLRIVRFDGFSVDVSGKANGRGAYICKNLDCLKLAIKSKGLERSFKSKVDGNLYKEIESIINE